MNKRLRGYLLAVFVFMYKPEHFTSEVDKIEACVSDLM